MLRVFSKIKFVQGITAGLPSMASLIWASKRLRWNKTGFLKAGNLQGVTTINIQHSLGRRTLYLRTYAGDIDIFYEIFYKQIYRLPLPASSEVAVVVDLGANVGLSALYFLHQYSTARVMCVEPDASNVAMLRKNLQQQIDSGQVEVIEAAVMGEDGMVAFESAEAKYNSRVTSGVAEKNIPAMSIATLMRTTGIAHIHILKVDVEGAEKFIFSNDTSWLSNVDNVIIEVHSAEDKSICLKALDAHHFKVVAIEADPNNAGLLWAARNNVD